MLGCTLLVKKRIESSNRRVTGLSPGNAAGRSQARRPKQGKEQQKLITVVHDNGVSGQRGITYYTEAEVAKLGGLDPLIRDYATHNIGIFAVDVIAE